MIRAKRWLDYNKGKLEVSLENANVVVGIVSSNEEHRGILVKLVKKLGAQPYVINFEKDNIPFQMMENIDCFLFGDGPPLHPTSYENGDEHLDCFRANKDLDHFEIEVLSKALDCLSILAVESFKSPSSTRSFKMISSWYKASFDRSTSLPFLS